MFGNDTKSILIKGVKNAKCYFLAFLTPQIIKTHLYQGCQILKFLATCYSVVLLLTPHYSKLLLFFIILFRSFSLSLSCALRPLSLSLFCLSVSLSLCILSLWVLGVAELSRSSWDVILESAWLVFLARVETREARPLGWWSSERLGWVLATVLWWVQIGVSLIWFWVLIWFWDCVLVLQCEGGKGDESQATAVEEDDN